MDSHSSKTGWDIILLGIPLLALLVFGFFHLDEVFTARKGGAPMPSHPGPPNEKQPKSMRSDPDGRPWDDP